MTVYKISNFAQSTLEVSVSVADTVLRISATDAAKFPALAGGEAFFLTIWDRVNAPEIVQVNTIVGQVLTVVRAQEGTAAVAWSAGTVVRLAVTAALFDSIRAGNLITGIAAPVAGQYLKFFGGVWINANISISDVTGLVSALAASTDKAVPIPTAGVANALFVTVPATVPIIDGTELYLRIGTVNTNVNVTLQTSLGTHSVVTADNKTPQLGQVQGERKVCWNAAFTHWRLVDSGAVNLSGGNLKFPAVQNPSADINTLDDYAEKTYTPVVSFGGNSVGITYALQQGAYTKIGNLISGTVRIILTNKGSSVGFFRISLPTNVSVSAGCPIGYLASFAALPAPLIGLTGTSSGGTIDFYVVNLAGGFSTNVTETLLTNSSDIIVSFTYQAP